MQNLIPVLTQQPFDEKWENIICFEMQVSLECEAFGIKADQVKYVKMAGMPGCLACCLAGKVLGGIPAKLREGYPNMRSHVEVGKEFLAEIGAKPFHGGDTPDQADISYFGTLVPFIRAGTQTVQDHLKNTGLNEWHLRMTHIMPSKW